MISEIRNEYQTFGDATISRIEYKLIDDETMLNQNELIVFISCLN